MDVAAFKERAVCAMGWLDQYAPEEFRYKIHSDRFPLEGLDPKMTAALVSLHKLVGEVDLDAIDPKELNQKIITNNILKLNS